MLKIAFLLLDSIFFAVYFVLSIATFVSFKNEKNNAFYKGVAIFGILTAGMFVLNALQILA